jgi:hypothetical protein
MGIESSTLSSSFTLLEVKSIIEAYHKFQTPIVTDKVTVLLLISTALKQNRVDDVERVFPLYQMDNVYDYSHSYV